MEKRGSVAIYILFILVMSLAVFSLVTTRTPQTTIISQDTEEVATTSDIAEENTETTSKESTEDIVGLEEETFIDKIIPALDSVKKIKDLVEEIINIREKEIPETTDSEPVVYSAFSPNNDSNLEKSGILYYTNLEREKEGLTPLKENLLLDEAALAKKEHMFNNQYFEHVAPSGEGVSYWVDNTGHKYISIGENLARGEYISEEKMVEDWMKIILTAYKYVSVDLFDFFFSSRRRHTR